MPQGPRICWDHPFSVEVQTAPVMADLTEATGADVETGQRSADRGNGETVVEPVDLDNNRHPHHNGTAIGGECDGAEAPPAVSGAESSQNGAASREMRATASTPEELISLMEQGYTRQQAEAIVVRDNQDQYLVTRFRRWILCFFCILCLACPTMGGIFIWMVVAWFQDRRKTCDVPLQDWVYVVYGVVAYNFFIGKYIIKFICRWQHDPQVPTRPPLRVRLFQGSIVLFIFIWNCLGLHWARVSGHIDSDERPCTEAAPMLRDSVMAYAAFNIAWTIFMWVNMIGLSQILAAMMRAGVLHTSQAAPKGALERNSEPVVYDEKDEKIKENPQCSVCLDDFDDKKPIVRTKACQHTFHKQCLQGWLQVNRTCPLCREDLGNMSQTTAVIGNPTEG
mmetsp:Transcript_4426/g.7649  ORF Transcript_4426/g.7649 Transcript_4426/m.7649 type:complete len:394 (-) Transcript_4426:166-1347(-)